MQRAAPLVAAGILLSRLAGLVRQRAFSHFLGLGDAADALSAAFRIPNLLQNLLGEGALSAAFIPVYARLRAQERHAEAAAVARAVAALLALVTSVIVLLGLAAAPWLVDLLAPGFAGAKRDLTIVLVRILFPGVGVLVLAAWCLGVLNSHGRFFLSYSAPVAWNVVIIVVTVLAGRDRAPEELVLLIAGAAVAGSLLQLGIQLPSTIRAVQGGRPADPPAGASREAVRTVARNFGPSVLSRGVLQVSAWVDMLIASLLGTGAAAALASAQMIGMLPASLFGMSVSAAALPAMAARTGAAAPARDLREELEAGWRRIAYFVVPSAMAFLAFGHVITGVLFQSGAFTAADSRYVWLVLAGAAVGLLASTLARLAGSTFFALGDTRTPFRLAAIRVGFGVPLGLLLALQAPGWLGVDPKYGVAGLTLAGGLAGWLEFALLRRALAPRIGPPRLEPGHVARLWLVAALAAAAGWAVLRLAEPWGQPLWGGLAVLGTYGATYLMVTRLVGIPEARLPGFRRGTPDG